MEDKSIECADCGDTFVWTMKEQEFYQTKGFSQPKRCKPCRQKKKAARERK